MQTVRVLDHYRLAIADDAMATKILATIVKDGFATEEDLVAHSDNSAPEIRKAVDRLYRANYIHRRWRGRWKATQLGKDVLERLGLVQAISEYIISDQPVEDESRWFLGARAASNKVGEHPGTTLALLQSIKVFQEEIGQLGDNSADALRRVLFATVVGLDPELKELGPERFWQRRAEPMPQGGHQFSDRLFISYCHRAISDVERSNVYLLEGDSSRGDQDSNFARLLSWIRLIGAASSGSPDARLLPIASLLDFNALGDRRFTARACAISSHLWLEAAPHIDSEGLRDDWLVLFSDKFQSAAAHGSAMAHEFQAPLALAAPEQEWSLVALSTQLENMATALSNGEHSEPAKIRALKELSSAAGRLREAADAIIQRFPP